MTALVAMVMRGDAPADAISRALKEPRVPTLPLAPGCALTLLRAYFSTYERKRPADRGSAEFGRCRSAQTDFLRSHVYPHIAERVVAGEFGRFVEQLRAYEIADAPTGKPQATASAVKPETNAEPE